MVDIANAVFHFFQPLHQAPHTCLLSTEFDPTVEIRVRRTIAFGTTTVQPLKIKCALLSCVGKVLVSSWTYKMRLTTNVDTVAVG